MSRPRKTNVRRDKSGKSRGEPMIVHAETAAVRVRELRNDGLPPEHALDQLAGFTLGRLLLRGRQDKKNSGGISQRQYDAGDEWAKLVRRHMLIMGYKPEITTPSFIMVGGGPGCSAGPADEVIQKMREKWRICYDALAAAAREQEGGGIRLFEVCYGVCVDNWPAGSLTNDDYGYLRSGLNALARVLG